LGNSLGKTSDRLWNDKSGGGGGGGGG